MFFWLNQRKKLQEILSRSGVSDDEFLQRIKLSGEIAKKTVQCCRYKLGEVYRIPPEKLYPDDSFKELIRLPSSDWDMLELIFFLEETLEIGIDEEQVPDWSEQKMTLGQWIVNLLAKSFPSYADISEK